MTVMIHLKDLAVAPPTYHVMNTTHLLCTSYCASEVIPEVPQDI